MKLSWRVELVQLVIVAAMFLLAAACWSHVPERMPIHWNLQGEVDRYGNKFAGLLLLPLLAAGVYVLLLVVPRFDPLRANYQSFAAAYTMIRVAILLFLGAVYVMTVLAALGYQVNITTFIALAVGMLFVLLGSVMGRLRPNWFVGVRTPWTLSSQLSWTKTHRLAGRLFVLMGLVMAAWGLVQAAWAFAVTMAIVAASVVWIIVYSYLVYRNDPERAKPA